MRTSYIAAALVASTQAVDLQAEWGSWPSTSWSPPEIKIDIPIVNDIIAEVEKVQEQVVQESVAALDATNGGATSEALAAGELLAIDAVSELHDAVENALEEINLEEGMEDLADELAQVEGNLHALVGDITNLCMQIVEGIDESEEAADIAFTVLETVYGIPPGTLSRSVGTAGELCEQIGNGEIDLHDLAGAWNGVEEVEEDDGIDWEAIAGQWEEDAGYWEDEWDLLEHRFWGVKRYVLKKMDGTDDKQRLYAYKYTLRQINKALGYPDFDDAHTPWM